MYLPFAMQVGHIDTYLASASSGNTFNVGIYNAAGTKTVESGPLSCTTPGAIVSTLGVTTGSSSPTVVGPGVIYVAWSEISDLCQPVGVNPYLANINGLLNATTNKYFTLSTLESGSPMQLPTTLGSAGTPYTFQNIIFAIFEP